MKDSAIVRAIKNKVERHAGDVADEGEEGLWTLAIDAAHDMGLTGDRATLLAQRAIQELNQDSDGDVTIDVSKLRPRTENFSDKVVGILLGESHRDRGGPLIYTGPMICPRGGGLCLNRGDDVYPHESEPDLIQQVGMKYHRSVPRTVRVTKEDTVYSVRLSRLSLRKSE